MPATDDMAARLQEKIDRSNAFIEELSEGARKAERDLTDAEHALIRDAREDLDKYNQAQAEMRETMRIVRESRANTAAMAQETARDRRQTDDRVAGKVEYRSAGLYVADRYLAMMGDEGANQRMEVFHRAAAHQTTADNPGLLPESRSSGRSSTSSTRPARSSPRSARRISAPAPGRTPGSPNTPRSGCNRRRRPSCPRRKMTITKTPLAAPTYGGYVNVSRQDISRTSPAILDMVIADLAGQYSIQTEAAAATDLTAAATAGPAIPATPTAANVATAIYTAAGSVFTATQGQGRTVIALSPDQFGIIAPLFPGVNPTNAFSTGFNAGDLAFGSVGAISGLQVVMSAGFAADTILVFSTAAVRCFEARYGALQVVEPSVWGVQVGYAGDFETVVIEATGVVRVTTA